jgi:hypothetical protein
VSHDTKRSVNRKERWSTAESNQRPPGKVTLFFGHMIDAPGRQNPRFPPDKEVLAARAIAATLTDLAVGEPDLCICGGNCGGDLLFAEAALALGAKLEIYIPFEEPVFLLKSVDFAGEAWRNRFFEAKARASLHIQPIELGALVSGEDPYERNHRWMLSAATRFGSEKVIFVCLWNGESGDGPGGTRHTMDQVRQHGGQTLWLNTKKLWG